MMAVCVFGISMKSVVLPMDMNLQMENKDKIEDLYDGGAHPLYIPRHPYYLLIQYSIIFYYCVI